METDPRCPTCNVILTRDEAALLRMCVGCYYRKKQDEANARWKEVIQPLPKKCGGKKGKKK